MIHTTSVSYVLPLVLVVLGASVIISWLIKDRDRTISLPTIAILLFGSGWSLGYALELLFVTTTWKVAFAALQYPFISFMPVAWLFFAASLAGYRALITKRAVVLISLVPLAMQIIIWTNSFHHQFWKDVETITQGPFLLLDFSYGPLFWFGYIYGFALLLTSIILMLYVSVNDRNSNIDARSIMVVAPLLPMLANIVYTQRWGPVPNLDLTPFAFTISGIIFGYGIIFRHLDKVSFGTRLINSENQLRQTKKQLEEINRDLQQELETRREMEKQLQYNELSLTRLVRERTDDLRTSEERIRLLLDSTMEGIIGLDAIGNCTFCNIAARNGLKFDEADILGKNVHALIHHSRADGLTNLLQDCKICNIDYQGLVVHSDEQVFWRLDNTSFAVECWSHPIIDNDKLVGSVITFIDIEHRRRQLEQEAYLHDQLRHSQKMEAIGTFSIGIAHDFNNILNGLKGCVELALDSEGNEQERQSYLNDALKSTDSGAELVGQILSYSRKTEVTKSGVNLVELVSSTLKLLRRTVPTTIEIDAIINVEDAWISADDTQIQQVLFNIFSNSVDAIDSSAGRIELLIEDFEGWSGLASTYNHSKSPRYLKLSIHDSGCGVVADDLEHVFEPYYTSKKPGSGTGMGLAVAYSIIENHAGYIDIESSDGEGTTVNVYLPRVKYVSPIVDTESATRNIRKANGRVLLVDDDRTNRRVFKAALEKIGCEVVTMNDGESAFSVYCEAQDEFDLVITDETMPRMSGATLAGQILKLRSEQAIILCSGYSVSIDDKQAKAMGISRYVTKPVSLRVLVEIAQDVLLESQQKKRR